MEFPGSFTVITDEVSQDLDTIRNFVKEFQLPGIELRSYRGRAFKDLTDGDAEEIAKAAREEGWKVFGCSTPVFKCELDSSGEIREHREIFKRSVELAHRLDCDLLRVFTFLRADTPLTMERVVKIAARLLELIDLIEGSEIRIGIENEHSCEIATQEELEALLAALPDDRFGAIWDPCNELFVPGGSSPEPEKIVQLIPRLFHMHLKDAIRRDTIADGELAAMAVPVGIGEVNWRSHFRCLMENGFSGTCSLETHWRVEAIDEESLHLPAGYAFSKGGESASRTSMHNVQAILQTLSST